MRIASTGLCLAIGLAAVSAAPAFAQNAIEPVTFATAEPVEARPVTAPLPPQRASAARTEASRVALRPVRQAPAPQPQRLVLAESTVLVARADIRWPLTLRPHVFALGMAY